MSKKRIVSTKYRRSLKRMNAEIQKGNVLKYRSIG